MIQEPKKISQYWPFITVVTGKCVLEVLFIIAIIGQQISDHCYEHSVSACESCTDIIVLKNHTNYS
jgi:hypothetical protein